MMIALVQRSLLALALGAALAGIPATAEVISFTAELKGGNEVPANGSAGTGTVALTYDPVEKKLSWKGSYAGLSGPVTAAHFHGPAVPGRNAGVVLPLPANLPPAFEGSATISDAQAAELLAGRWYLNLHTAANPAGEIRGQVSK